MPQPAGGRSPLRAGARLCPPRLSDVYKRQRRGWAGRVQVGGHIVCDSVANNACAHYLHLLFFLAIPPGRPAQPLAHQTELYRANAIETFDTLTARIQTCLLYPSRCV